MLVAEGLCIRVMENMTRMDATYQISRDRDEIVIRFPRHLIDEQELSKLLDYLELEAIRRRSELSEEDAVVLAADIKQGAWQQVKHLFAK